ncbi:MAG TPA: D-amino acid dehydrogenase [Rhodocyclaceae bacterium]|nr:D-amino acid dehydrogenase [Rhodocyclaceae bacterium]
MRVIVMGAGVVGTTAAWYLTAAGHEVTVVDRQPAAGLETSFANGGQISVCHAEPWANPGALPKLLKWIGHESSPLLWRMRADPAQWAWGLRFIRECTPGRTRANIIAILKLALHSRGCLQALRAELGLEYDHLQRGILHVYTDAREFEHAIPQAELMRQYGCDRFVKTAEECLQIEPALRYSTRPLVGGTYTADDESGDAHKFTQALAARCAERGVVYRYGNAVTALQTQAGQISGVRLDNGELLTADAYVVALGSYTSLLLRPLGLHLPIYPGKGYSATLTLRDDAVAPSVSITDDGHKLVYSRFGNRLRVAGTAEFTGYDTSLNTVRCEALIRRTQALFPLAVSDEPPQFWAGLRPATPSNVPYVGQSRYGNLFVNSGHGTLGWTMSCGSGQVLADLVSGRAPEIDPAPYRVKG